MQSRPTFEQVRDAVMAHVRARGWDEENTGRGLAISISLEASELLEYFQWQEENVGDTEDLASELADIIIYAIQFADKYGIDILPEVLKKLDKTAKKYPVEIFDIKDKEERNRVWREAKLSYEKDTTL
jgi:NTP pyrophosphatase (non-canonical NTP hydrolase)